MIRAGKPCDGSDRSDQPDCHHHVDARDRHQPGDVGIGSGLARQLALDDLQILTQSVVLAQMPGGTASL